MRRRPTPPVRPITMGQIDAAWDRVAHDCGCPDLFYCPLSEDVECPRHGGFSRCCARPDAHVPVRMSEELRDRLDDSWPTRIDLTAADWPVPWSATVGEPWLFVLVHSADGWRYRVDGVDDSVRGSLLPDAGSAPPTHAALTVRVDGSLAPRLRVEWTEI